MDEQPTKELTSKGRRTRERILETAVELFAQRGYEGTTMRDIATGAACSLGLAYHYFASKEAIVLALYARLADEMEAQARELPPATLAEGFDQAFGLNVALLAPYREAMTTMFGPALNPQSDVSVLGESNSPVRRKVAGVFARVVSEATDTPPADQAERLATVLYGLHLALILFWLQDRSPNQQATEDLRAFVRDALALVVPLLELPMAAEVLARLARIAGPALNS
jgi:AcrR family transcriptional regulator